MRTRIYATCLMTVLLLLARELAAQSKPAEATLAAKGLTKVGQTYVVANDLNLRDGLRALRHGKRELEIALSKRSQLEKKIGIATSAYADDAARIPQLQRNLAQASGVPLKYDQIVGQLNVLKAEMNEAMAFAEQCRAELKKLSETDPREAYVAATLDLSESMESAVHQYEVLAADPEVQRALDRVNAETRAKVKLGPSEEFTRELQFVRHERATINSAAIKFNNENGVPEVTVVLNGNQTVRMILDSGASLVCISWELAQQLGMNPGPNDQKNHATLADGRTVETTLMTLKSVRLGPFTAENVLCSVASREEKGTENLLGGSFLRNFVYRMDLAAGVVHMSQLTGVLVAKNSEAPRSSSPGSAPGGSGNDFPPSPPTSRPVNEQPAADPKLLIDRGWTILFRSSKPAQWNTQVHDSDSYAVTLDNAPLNMLYLRMRNSLGEYVIIPLSADELGRRVLRDKFGWEGRNYDTANACHLGIINKSLPATGPEAIDITQSPQNSGWTGYGFGNRVGKDDQQGFIWAGKPLQGTMLEIAVKATDLTAAEKQRLLSE
jgi:clan AA aspartic protease (TIGR02281 family)